MAVKRKVPVAQGQEVLYQYVQGQTLTTAQMQLLVRYTLEEFATRFPGETVEIRIPWYAAVQAIAGVKHTRGTPPNVVEMDAKTWLHLVLKGAVDKQKIYYSGAHADIFNYFPLANLF